MKVTKKTLDVQNLVKRSALWLAFIFFPHDMKTTGLHSTTSFRFVVRSLPPARKVRQVQKCRQLE